MRLTTLHNRASVGPRGRGWLNAAAVGALLALAAPVAALAEGGDSISDAVTMAPPVTQAAPQGIAAAHAGASAASDTVFNWQEIPADQRVPIQRAIFDQGGYQLYDTVGETIVVPFENGNLYVMKFAVSPDGTTYFENTGGAPVLYLPRGGYLDNATVSDARWYPFSDDFHPVDPVYLGVAPSYDDYEAMGWAPGLSFYGGYYNALSVGLLTPTAGLFVSFGGHPYTGWDGYAGLVAGHPAFEPVGLYHPYVYRYAGPSYWGTRSFAGGDPPRGVAGGFGGGGGGGRTFSGSGQPYAATGRAFGGGERDYSARFQGAGRGWHPGSAGRGFGSAGRSHGW